MYIICHVPPSITSMSWIFCTEQRYQLFILKMVSVMMSLNNINVIVTFLLLDVLYDLTLHTLIPIHVSKLSWVFSSCYMLNSHRENTHTDSDLDNVYSLWPRRLEVHSEYHAILFLYPASCLDWSTDLYLQLNQHPNNQFSLSPLLWLLNGSKCPEGSCMALYPECYLPMHIIPNWMTSIQYPVYYQWDYTGMLTTGNLLSKGLTNSHLHSPMTQR